MKGRLATTLTIAAVTAMIVGCNKSADSFSLLSDTTSAKQSAQYVPRKVDVLWVIDNSGSMASSQDALATHFSSFIKNFTSIGADFHMAVTTTDAYLQDYYHDTTWSRIRDGAGSNHSGVFVMDKATPSLDSVFLTDIKQGTAGSGDERAFSSFEVTLSNTWQWNVAFRRPDAFLAVIIVSDEDDFSHTDLANGTYNFTENYNDPSLYSIQHYVDYLTSYTANAGAGKNFSVNAISIFDQDCLTKLKNSEQKLNQRYAALIDATGGKKISLCDDFTQSLDDLSKSIAINTAVFQLSRIPIPESIVVTVNGIVIPQDPNTGWVYDAASNSIQFSQSAVPADGSDVRISFDPKGVKN
jgi:hypothetical protein